jgi:hypothetical protein
MGLADGTVGCNFDSFALPDWRDSPPDIETSHATAEIP